MLSHRRLPDLKMLICRRELHSCLMKFAIWIRLPNDNHNISIYSAVSSQTPPRKQNKFFKSYKQKKLTLTETSKANEYSLYISMSKILIYVNS